MEEAQCESTLENWKAYALKLKKELQEHKNATLDGDCQLCDYESLQRQINLLKLKPFRDYEIEQQKNKYLKEALGEAFHFITELREKNIKGDNRELPSDYLLARKLEQLINQ
jgi:hypothetical protein